MAAVRALRGAVNGAGPGGPREQAAALTRDFLSQPRLSECGACGGTRGAAGGGIRPPRGPQRRARAGRSVGSPTPSEQPRLITTIINTIINPARVPPESRGLFRELAVVAVGWSLYLTLD